ncbi:cytochrome c oxidase assembly protein [Mycolicibacterium komossense]|uniref:Cytochrome c oxidase assembly protein n=1 Tax=Mycolicibacterium komossense TaxID=1779 RepID=A0ABT3CI57_9MYCO|nr:cytochrome c oxidase assembly protein [Mycolicibacterium komossense]MCV7229145.1 cytochrome c oxidase assembly protein [Mycolicibacterium komossense]
MHPATTPLTLATALSSWRLDVSSAVAILLIGGFYLWGTRVQRRRGVTVAAAPLWCFGIGCSLWALATMSMIGVYAGVLFWVRALQVLTLLFLVPFFLAMGRPLTLLRDVLTAQGRARLDAVLAGPAARVVAHPVSTSIAMLGTPWLLYLTPWYRTALESAPVGAATNAALVLIGFGYFYARLQTDPVPRRYSQLISVVISIVETIGDGLLGLVLWLGPVIAVGYYDGLQRTWGPSQRLDQTIGAGVLWILGDVLGVPFLIMLMHGLSVDERARSVEVDAALDDEESARADPQPEAATSRLWWEDDPQLRDRFNRLS